jgi:sec-independent protein translocase protein TatC
MPEETAQTHEPWDEEEDEVAASRMPFLEHLEELRMRLVRAAIAVGVGFFVAYAFKERLYGYLTIPLKKAMPPGAKLIYTAPQEAFFTYLKVAFLAGVIGASPVIFYQLWRFVSPGLYRHERRAIWPFVIISSVLFVCGAVFCYAIVFPYAFQFFMSFATAEITPMLKLNEYLSFTATLLFAFGVVFEMPLVLVFLGRLGVVTSQGLRRWRKYAILVMFIAAAVFTPPDVVSQILMALPLIMLYEVSIILVAAAQRKKARREAEMEAEWGGEDEKSADDEDGDH